MDELTAVALAARDGDRVALAAFVRSTQPQVRRLCAHVVGRDLADDVTQDTYLRAIGALGAYRGDAAAHTWLLSIARRVAADALRRTVRRRRLVGRLAGRALLPAPPPSTPVDMLLAPLDAERREAFVLTQLLGLTYAEAAAVCGCPVGTIRSWVARARETLVAGLQEEVAAVASRVFVAIAVAVVWLVAGSDPAAADSVSGVGATNYQTRLEDVRPAVPGVRLRVVEVGSRLELSNTTSEDVVVLGYQDEPYLRVGPDGVFENRRSPAVYLNANRRGSTAVPRSADPDAEPDWTKTSDATVVRWHDHRIHWMGSQDPPAVRRDPDREHVVIPEWTVTLLTGDRTIRATGELRWIPGPGPLPWVALAVVLLSGVALLALTRAWATGLAIVVAAVVTADIIHTIGIGWARAGGVGAKLGQMATSSPYSLVAWAAGIVAVVLLARRRPDGLVAAGFAGIIVAVFGGLVDLTDLTRSQVPFAWTPTLDRIVVAASIGAGLGLATAAVIGVRRHPVNRGRPARTAPLASS